MFRFSFYFCFIFVDKNNVNGKVHQWQHTVSIKVKQRKRWFSVTFSSHKQTFGQWTFSTPKYLLKKKESMIYRYELRLSMTWKGQVNMTTIEIYKNISKGDWFKFHPLVQWIACSLSISSVKTASKIEKNTSDIFCKNFFCAERTRTFFRIIFFHRTFFHSFLYSFICVAVATNLLLLFSFCCYYYCLVATAAMHIQNPFNESTSAIADLKQFSRIFFHSFNREHCIDFSYSIHFYDVKRRKKKKRNNKKLILSLRFYSIYKIFIQFWLICANARLRPTFFRFYFFFYNQFYHQSASSFFSLLYTFYEKHFFFLFRFSLTSESEAISWTY